MGERIVFHKDLFDSGRWAQMSFAAQMANIGSEISRACNWKNKGNSDRMFMALARALELLDMTLDCSCGPRLKELCRLREVVCDYFVGDNIYGSTESSMRRYFDIFAAAMRNNEERQVCK